MNHYWIGSDSARSRAGVSGGRFAHDRGPDEVTGRLETSQYADSVAPRRSGISRLQSFTDRRRPLLLLLLSSEVTMYQRTGRRIFPYENTAYFRRCGAEKGGVDSDVLVAGKMAGVNAQTTDR